MKNLLLEGIEYKIDRTRLGVWRRFLGPSGFYFAEFKSHRTLFGLPLLHYTRGKCPETGKRVVAKGVVAVGRLAVGILAIGHASMGLIAVGQAAFGLLFGIGQLSTGLAAIGQMAIAAGGGLGQVATGWIAVGQIGAGIYVLAQVGIGQHVWSQGCTDPGAVEFFQSLVANFLQQ
jgi:hypothetical protein